MSKSESSSFSTSDEAVVDLTSNKYAAWVVEIAERTASMIARRQGVSFTHGVMNADNMTILGLTIDYGPFGFLMLLTLNLPQIPQTFQVEGIVSQTSPTLVYGISHSLQQHWQRLI